MSDTQRFEPTDDELLGRFSQDPDGPRGRAAVSTLLGRHQRKVYLWCHRYVRDPEKALDLAQEVLLNAYRALPKFEGRSRFTSWLFAITRNRCLNALAAPGLLVDEEVELEGIADPAAPPEAGLAEQEDEEQLRRLLIEHLDEDERTALWLRCYEHMPVDEIGRVLKLENATGARALLQRARRRLRAALEAQHEGGGS